MGISFICCFGALDYLPCGIKPNYLSSAAPLLLPLIPDPPQYELAGYRYGPGGEPNQ
jgi:hypothetical protein